MVDLQTEKLHQDASGLDQWPLDQAATLLAQAQSAAASSAERASSDIARAALAMSATVRGGAVLHYAAAGSSGLMAAADAQELGGTFSISPDQIRIHMAGGLPTGVEMPGDTEDATGGLATSLRGISSADCLVAVSASGTTPYTLAAAEVARDAGATVIAIANNADTPLLGMADHAIHLDTPPEVLSGSTRMGAGTAQKIALNMLSTLMAIDLGHVHDGMMVNLRADNKKLRQRAVRIVRRIASVGEEEAAAALGAVDGEVKAAVLVASGRATPENAFRKLDAAAGRLRVALA